MSEAQFHAAFLNLLRSHIDEARRNGTQLLDPVARARALTRSAATEEARQLYDLALKTPALRPLTWDVSGRPIKDIRLWLPFTFGSAIARYYRLGEPRGRTGRTKSQEGRLRQVADEVIIWAKTDPVLTITTTPVYGIRTQSTRKFNVNENTVLRRSTLEEWSEVMSGPMLIQPLCLERKEELPRLAQPALTVPLEFVRALELVSNSPVVLGDTRARAALPSFGLTNYSTRAVGEAPPTFPQLTILSSRDLRRARGIAEAFRHLQDSGFDLAVDLYSSFLHRRGGRERAVEIAIALENLYLRGMGRELTYRFQLHVARFGRRLPAKDRIEMSRAKDLYDARSTVVHGDWGGKKARAKVLEAVQTLNVSGAALVRSTLLAITRSVKARQALERISDDVKRRM